MRSRISTSRQFGICGDFFREIHSRASGPFTYYVTHFLAIFDDFRSVDWIHGMVSIKCGRLSQIVEAAPIEQHTGPTAMPQWYNGQSTSASQLRIFVYSCYTQRARWCILTGCGLTTNFFRQLIFLPTVRNKFDLICKSLTVRDSWNFQWRSRRKWFPCRIDRSKRCGRKWRRMKWPISWNDRWIQTGRATGSILWDGGSSDRDDTAHLYARFRCRWTCYSYGRYYGRRRRRSKTELLLNSLYGIPEYYATYGFGLVAGTAILDKTW